MEIYLLRHGKAEDAGPGMSDRERRLTAEGVESMKAELPGIRKMAGRVDYILTSPYPRAEETALLAASLYGLDDKVERFEVLCLADAERMILDRLRKLPPDAAVMLVGHSPLLDELADFLAPPEEPVMLKKGGLLKIVFKGKPKQGKGKLEWVLKPKELKNPEML